jgi:putative tricarboxylic transport membrane protein
MDRRIDLAGSLAITLIGAAVLTYSVLAPPPPRLFDLVGPFGLPALIGSVMAALGAWQSFETWRRMRRWGPIGVAEGTEDEPGYPSSSIRALGFMAGGIVYAVTLPILGFLTGTPLAIAAGLWALDFRRPFLVVAAAVGYTAVAFIVFNQVLSVPLPLGPLNDLLVDLGIVDRIR